MTVTVPYPLSRPTWPHRAAVRLGRALVAWGAAPGRGHATWSYEERLRSFERSRDPAAHVLPQLPR